MVGVCLGVCCWGGGAAGWGGLWLRVAACGSLWHEEPAPIERIDLGGLHKLNDSMIRWCFYSFGGDEDVDE